MALRYEDVSRFVRENGNVTARANPGEVTLLQNGDLDAVKLVEQEAVQFDFEGRSYDRAQFEKLVASRLGKK